MSKLHVACKLLKQNTHTVSPAKRNREATTNVMLEDATGILIGI